MTDVRSIRPARARRALASAVVLGAALTSCTAADGERAPSTEPSSTTTTTIAAPSDIAPVASSASPTAPCAIATGCAVPQHPTTLDVEPLPDGWTIADATTEERGPAESADTIVRVLTAPSGARVWVSLLRDDWSTLPPEDASTPRPLDGGWTAYLRTTPMRNYPPDVVESMVVLRLSDDLLVMARGQHVPPDDVVAVVESLVIA